MTNSTNGKTTQFTPKTLMIVLIFVITLHAVVAVVMINLPRLGIKPLPSVEPLEITLVKPQPSVPKMHEPTEQFKPIPTNTTSPLDATAQKPKPEKVQEPNPPKTRPTSTAKAKPTEQRPADNTVKQPVQKPLQPIDRIPPQDTSSDIPTKPVETVKSSESKLIVPAEPSTEPNTISTQQTTASEKIRENLAEQADNPRQFNHLQDIDKVKQQAEQQQAELQARQQEIHKQQLEQQKAKQIEAEKAEQAKKLAQNNEPISFGNGDAAWKTKPNLNFSGNLARIIEVQNLSNIEVQLHVNDNGQITSVIITRSSGNAQVDSAVLQRLRSAKLKPFIRNGVAVGGIGNLTIKLN